MASLFHKKFQNPAQKYLLLYAVFILQWLIFLTCFKKYRGEKLDDTPYVILFWHGRLALMPFAFLKFKLKGKKSFVMISRHNDGEFIANLVKLYGLNSVRGSTSNGALQVLKNAFKILKEKNDIIITPDGPRGPFHSVSDGSVSLAQKMRVKVRILNYEASRFWEFKSWDKMILPKPFCRINYSLSEPFDITNLDKEAAKKLILTKFNEAYRLDSFGELNAKLY